MPQYDIINGEYVERTNNLFNTVMQADENGELWNKRYNKDAWSRPKAITDYSLFSATWTYGIPARVWEENEVDGSTMDDPLYTPQSVFTKVTSREHMLSVKSGTVVDTGYAIRSKRYPKYQPNRGQLMSTAAFMLNPTALGIRYFGLSGDHDGVYFQLEGTGTEWDLFAIRRLAGVAVNKTSIKSILPDGFDPGKGHLYDIQYQWRGVANYFFYIDLELVGIFKLKGTLDALSLHDPALPVEYTSICKENGTEIEINAGCVDVTSEGGVKDRKIPGNLDTGDALLTLSASNIDTAILALRVPRTITYNSEAHANSRGMIMDKLVTWTRDEALTKAFVFRDLVSPNLEGLTWLDMPDSLFNYLVGGTTTALDTAFLLDKASGEKLVSEWADQDFKNVVENTGDNSDFYLTPGDILVISVAAITTNVKSAAGLYMSEEI